MLMKFLVLSLALVLSVLPSFAQKRDNGFLIGGQIYGVANNDIQGCIDQVIVSGGACHLTESATPYTCAAALTSRGAAWGSLVIEAGATLLCAPPDPTGPITSVSLGAPGAGYTVNDLLTLAGGGGTGGTSVGQVTVDAINGTGGVTSISAISLKTTGPEAPIYSVGQGFATTGGTGTGATVNVTSIGFGGFRVIDLNPMIFQPGIWQLAPPLQQGTLELANNLFLGGTLNSYYQQLTVGKGLGVPVAAVSVVAGSASVATTNILGPSGADFLTSATAGNRYGVKFNIHQAAAGTSCIGPASAFATVGWTNETGVTLSKSTAALNLQGTGSASSAQDDQSVFFIASPSSAITYSITWMDGPSCSPQPKQTFTAVVFAY